MIWLVRSAVIALLLVSSPVKAEFRGELVLEETTPPQNGNNKKLKYDFGYVDPNGIGWEASAGLETDGASIPGWAQSIVGNAFDESFIKAAVIHDHYCDRFVRPWRQTHRVFYDILLESQVPSVKAKVMYYAVLVGGPKWKKLVAGQKCKITEVCAKDFRAIEESVVIEPRGAIYEKVTDLQNQLSDLDKILSTSPNLTLEEIETIAARNNTTNQYLGKPDTTELEYIGATQ